MRIAIAVAAVLLAACANSGTDLDATDQGVCSNLEVAACRANAQCQVAYVDSAFQPSPSFMHCLLIVDGPTPDNVCSAQSYDGCRARKECTPLYWQELGPDDGPVGDPTYQSCTTEAELGI